MNRPYERKNTTCSMNNNNPNDCYQCLKTGIGVALYSDSLANKRRTIERYGPPRYNRPPNNIFCGNPRNIRNNQRMGTPYQCLKKGIGTGLYIIYPNQLQRNRGGRDDNRRRGNPERRRGRGRNPERRRGRSRNPRKKKRKE